MNTKKLTTLEATMLITGSGLGTGILAIPYIAAKTGLFGILTALAAAYIISIVLHLMVADLALHSENSTQLIGIFKEHLFCTKNGKLLSSLFFIVLSVVLLLNLTIYIVVAADIVLETFNLSLNYAKIIFYAVSSLIVLFGIKIIGVSEKYSMILIAAVILFLSLLSINNARNDIAYDFGHPSMVLSLYGMIMFSFSALFSVPQVANNIEDKTKIKTAVFAGIGANALITFFFTLAVLIASNNITRVATIGLSDSLGQRTKTLCSIFVILAMLTSYWSIALAQLDIISEEMKINRKLSWLIATVPTLFMSIFLPGTLISYIQIVGGVVAIIAALLIVPAYYKAVKHSHDRLILGKYGKSKSLLYIIFAFYILMAISSFIKIN